MVKISDSELYKIVDIQTRQQIGELYKDRRRAQRRADKLDLRYGAVRFIVIRIK